MIGNNIHRLHRKPAFASRIDYLEQLATDGLLVRVPDREFVAFWYFLPDMSHPRSQVALSVFLMGRFKEQFRRLSEPELMEKSSDMQDRATKFLRDHGYPNKGDALIVSKSQDRILFGTPDCVRGIRFLWGLYGGGQFSSQIVVPLNPTSRGPSMRTNPAGRLSGMRASPTPTK
jgi:hypothetical protein